MMEITSFQQKISALFPNMDLRFNESMAKHTSFRIGGGAVVMAFPKNAGAQCMLCEAPAPVTQEQLDELFIATTEGQN